MFTGLVEAVGKVERVEPRAGSRRLLIAAGFASELNPGDSVAVSGCCLTVVEPGNAAFAVEAVAATLEQTTLGRFRPGQRVNLERALQAGARFGGHFVQGHVDETGKVRRVTRHAGYHELAVEVKRESAGWLVPKGSVGVDGVSLTVARTRPGEFSVNVIPHTWEDTTLRELRPGSLVNVEFDLLVKAVRAGNDK